MNKETINLPRLISLIAEGASVSPATARRFLHDLFAYVEDCLEEGEAVKIDGIGEFVRGDDSANPVLFKADADLAAIANEPFSAFSAVTLNDDAVAEIENVNTPAIEQAAVVEEQVPEPQEDQVIEVSEPEQPIVSEPVDEIEEPAQPEAEVQTEPIQSEEDSVENDEVVETAEVPAPVVPEQEPATAPEPVLDEAGTVEVAKPEEEEEAETAPVENGLAEKPDDENHAAEQKEDTRRYAQAPGYRKLRHRDYSHNHPAQSASRNSSGHAMWLVLGVLIGLIIGLIGGYFAGKTMQAYELPDDDTALLLEDTDLLADADPVQEVKADTIPVVEHQAVAQNEAAEEVKESAKPAEQAPAKAAEPVYDTITSSRYLSILARDHYGVKNYWIFIYQANPQLGNPNQIRPGTKVLIPARESFEEATKAQTDAKAQKLLNQLAKKYKF